MIACILRFFKGQRGSRCELGQVPLLHLEHGINLINLRQSGRVQIVKKKRELQIIYIYDCCLL